ncbi:hypothetical protein [Xanthocytophaga agilis]|uniref:Uncharacterized protein n=1 Tax=Xanthocytophaga agilis TaxID=3048010 RepID=A0AAE3QZP4_9BACT|nr:hypothetical protein [Xanthocytophaga agilis]MDJ1500450.1 hypothetical protein [Xanthocytophaga agilis]
MGLDLTLLNNNKIKETLEKLTAKAKKYDVLAKQKSYALSVLSTLESLYPEGSWPVTGMRDIIYSNIIFGLNIPVENGAIVITDQNDLVSNILEALGKLIEMHLEFLKIRKVQQNILKASLEKPRICMYEGCLNLTNQGCHIIAESLLLKMFAPDRQVWTTMPDFFSNNGRRLKFYKKGIAKQLTFHGYCYDHDTPLFREIEGTNLFNPHEYRHLILQTYRTFCYQLRLKEIVLDTYQNYLQEPTLQQNLTFQEGYEGKKAKMAGEVRALCMLNTYKVLLDNHVKDRTLKDFEFKVYTFPKIPFCSYFIHFIPTILDVTYDADHLFNLYQHYTETQLIEETINHLKIKNPTQDIKNLLLKHTATCNLVSDRANSYFIVGYHKSSITIRDFCIKLDKLDTNTLLKEISDLLLKYVESWMCSPAFYREHIQPNEAEILRIREYFGNNPSERDYGTISFNLFENI